jgi:hypothetical protein
MSVSVVHGELNKAAMIRKLPGVVSGMFLPEANLSKE